MPHNNKENTQGVTHRMLAYILAIAIALTSLSLYLSAFFLPELHRKDDFLWSGVGLFYALILWVCAERITGAVLLGQSAATALVLAFGWQTVRLRRAIAHPEEQTDLSGFSFLNWLQSRLGGKKQPLVTPPTPSPVAETATEQITEPSAETLQFEEEEETFIQAPAEAIAPTEEIIEELEKIRTVETSLEEPFITPEEELPSPTVSEEPIEEPVEAIATPVTETEIPPLVEPEPEPPAKKGFSIKSFFGLGKSPKSQPEPEKITETAEQDELELEEEDWDNSERVEELETVIEMEVIEEKPVEIAETVQEFAELETTEIPVSDVTPTEPLETVNVIVEDEPTETPENLEKSEIEIDTVAFEEETETPEIEDETSSPSFSDIFPDLEEEEPAKSEEKDSGKKNEE